MTSQNRTVYLCYRRDTCQFIADRIYHRLKNANFDVFMEAWYPISRTSEISKRHILACRFFIWLVDSVRRSYWWDSQLNEAREIARYSGRHIIKIPVHQFKDTTISWLNYDGQVIQLIDHSPFTKDEETFNTSIKQLIEEMNQSQINPVIFSSEYRFSETTEPTEQQLKAEGFLNKAHILEHVSESYNKNLDQDILENINQAIAVYPDYADAYYRKAKMYRWHLETEKYRLEALNKAILLQPERAEYYFERSTIYRKLGDIDAKISDMNKSINLCPQLTWYRYSYSATLASNGQVASALSELQIAMEIDAENKRSIELRHYLKRSFLYLRLGDYDKAKSDYEYVLQNRKRSRYGMSESHLQVVRDLLSEHRK